MKIKEVYKSHSDGYILENYCLYSDELECCRETLGFANYLKSFRDRDIKTIRYKMISIKYWYEYISSIELSFSSYITINQQLGFLEHLNNKENKQKVIEIRDVMKPKYGKGFANSTINTHMDNIRQFYEYLMEYGYINLKSEELPFRKELGISNRKLEVKKIPGFLTVEEVNIMIDTALSLRDKLIVLMMFSTGLRIGELCSLKVDAINFKRYTIELKREYLDLETGCLKTGERFLKGNKTLFGLLQRYYLLERNSIAKCDNVFVTLSTKGGSDKGIPLNINAVKQIFKRLKLKTGIKECHAHALRHAFATNFISLREKNDKVSLAVLQKLLGHKNLDTTMIYTHVDYSADEYSNTNYFEEFIDKNFVDNLNL